MKKTVTHFLILSLIFLFTACNDKKPIDQYIKLAEYEKLDQYAVFIDVKNNEIVFVNLYEQKIENRIPIK